MSTKERIPRALTAKNVIEQEFELLPLKGAWHDAFGEPERTGVWLAWGNSGSGKGSFMIQLAKMLSEYGDVFIDDLEEGGRHTFKVNALRYGLSSAQGKVLVRKEDMATLDARLSKPRSPEIVIINTVQYMHVNTKWYRQFAEKYARKKLLVFFSQADGKRPKGTLADDIKYDADLKIWVEGFKAFSNGRTWGATKEYTIWEEGAAEYWGQQEIEQ
ncbi:MAG: ATP-dependent serine protease [Bacteroidetes bacterium]|nr:MAG: ATP-dependent serine protease [Bacteroidota bacterium]